MRIISIFVVLFITAKAIAGTGCGINVSATVNAPSCFNGTNGSISLSVSGGTVPQTSTKGLLISEFLANPSGSDSPFEYIELFATKSISFATTPYTIIICNNGIASSNGWIAGTDKTYAFSITTGSVNAGDVIYVGGSSMAPSTNRFRTINTNTTAGDGGIGTANPSGIMGNDGANADGIAVFDLPVATITAASVPVDAIFYGNAIGQAFVSNSTGYQLPVNDRYNGGKLLANSFFISSPQEGFLQRATGVYDVATNTFATARTWVNNASLTEGTSSISLGQLYNYAWSNGATTQNLSDVPNGQYSVTITDANSCQQVEFYNVIEPGEIAINLTFLDATCFGLNDGGANTLLFGGTPNFSFAWSNGATTQNLSGVVAGDYTLTVTDANNCTAEATAFISGFDEMIIDLQASDVTCSNAGDGAILTQVTNAISQLSYAWSNGATSGDLSQLVAGTYTLTVTDDLQCTATATAVIEELDDIDFEINTRDVSCFGGNDGTAAVFNVTGSGGNFTSVYSTISGEIGITDGVGNAAEITAGEYTVVLFKLNNQACGVQKTFTITQPDELLVSGTVTDASSSTATDGAISLNISGGTTPYDVVWSNNANGSIINNLAAGNYCVTVTDDAGCEATECFDVDFTVGVNNITNAFAANAYTTNNLLAANIQFTEIATLTVETYNMNGALMFAETKANASEMSILQNTANWSKGIYLVHFSANNNSVVKRVLVQ
jgi:hypothetical protein